MLAFLRGRAAGVAADHLIVDVGGVGYRVFASRAAIAAVQGVGTEVQIRVRMVVREDDVSLFGFADADEEDVFGRLTAVSGVGPRLALAVLASLNPAALRTAVARGDAARLRAVSGVGKKLADRMILELKDRLGPGPEAPATPGGQALGALMALGITESEALSALEGLDGPLEEVVRSALRRLGEGKR